MIHGLWVLPSEGYLGYLLIWDFSNHPKSCFKAIVKWKSCWAVVCAHINTFVWSYSKAKNGLAWPWKWDGSGLANTWRRDYITSQKTVVAKKRNRMDVVTRSEALTDDSFKTGNLACLLLVTSSDVVTYASVCTKNIWYTHFLKKPTTNHWAWYTKIANQEKV